MPVPYKLLIFQVCSANTTYKIECLTFGNDIGFCQGHSSLFPRCRDFSRLASVLPLKMDNVELVRKSMQPFALAQVSLPLLTSPTEVTKATNELKTVKVPGPNDVLNRGLRNLPRKVITF